ncbi:PhnD/SsuA/transferrin family substrate-binding protein [Shewanella waksmanii]|uniref:sensor histidine kinase n=1 Tax=Shewanella waksmanii TaxID=213783 RepID=UPI0037358511
MHVIDLCRRYQLRLNLLLIILLSSSLTAVLAQTPARHLEPQPYYTVGALAFTSTDRVYNRWAPTLAHVSNQTGIPLKLVTLTPDELVEQVANNKLDFILGNALITVALKKDYGVSHLLNLVPNGRTEPEHAVGSALIARSQLNITNLKELRSLRVISADPNAFGGFQILAGELIEQGINPLSDLEQLKFVGFPQDKLLDDLLAQQADVAILPTCVLENAIEKGDVPVGELHVLLAKQTDFICQTSSQLYPSYAFSKLGHTDHQVATAITLAMLSINATDPEAVIGRYQNWSVPVKDNHVYALLKQLKHWPFVTNWQRLLQDATPWAIAIAIVLFLGYLHHLRVKRLVIKRTHALSQEMKQHQTTQKALFEQQKQFYKAQRVLLTGEMASGIAHELNQPLAGIRYLTQGCLYRLDDSQTEISQALNKTIEQVDRAQSTIKRLRHFCQQPSVYDDVELSQLISETLKLMQPDFKRAGVSPELKLQTVDVSCDASLMQQVLVNLLRNALDAMEPMPQKQLTIELSAQDSQACIRIIDSGSGLTDQALKRLFFPFETSKENGLGLGMVVCKRIVEEHGGQITAHNKPLSRPQDTHQANPMQNHDTGLIITVTLPIKVAAHG